MTIFYHAEIILQNYQFEVGISKRSANKDIEEHLWKGVNMSAFEELYDYLVEVGLSEDEICSLLAKFLEQEAKCFIEATED